MPDAVVDYLEGESTWESPVAWLYGLDDLDRRCFRTLAESPEPLTVEEVADAVERDRSTAYRSVRRLHEAGVVEKAQVNYDQGGYYHVYRAREAEDLADEMQRLLNDFYAAMGQSIAQFRNQYEAPERTEE